MAAPELVRRSLHRDKFQKGGIRPRFGGTSNGCFLRKGDYVEAEKAGKVYRGWVCGLPTEKTAKVGVMDVFGKRIGQFSVRKVRLLCRRTGVMWMIVPVANSSHLFKGGNSSPVVLNSSTVNSTIETAVGVKTVSLDELKQIANEGKIPYEVYRLTLYEKLKDSDVAFRIHDKKI